MRVLRVHQVKYGVRSPKFIWAPCAQLYSLAETPQPPPPFLPHLGSYTRALLVSQDRRHLYVTLWYDISLMLVRARYRDLASPLESISCIHIKPWFCNWALQIMSLLSMALRSIYRAQWCRKLQIKNCSDILSLRWICSIVGTKKSWSNWFHCPEPEILGRRSILFNRMTLSCQFLAMYVWRKTYLLVIRQQKTLNIHYKITLLYIKPCKLPV